MNYTELRFTRMKFLPGRLLVFFMTLSATCVVHATSTTVSTDPVGFTTLTVNGSGTAGVSAYTLASVDLTRPADYSGVIPAGIVTTGTAGGTVLTFGTGTFAGLTLSGSAASHYIEITNGSGAGVMSTILSSDNDHTITLADDLSAVIDNAGGTTTFKTRPHWTFATLFGVNNSAGLSGSTSVAFSDTIQTMGPSGVLATYYYNTRNSRWQTGGGADATNIILSPEVGLLITRKQPTPVAMVLQGNVKLGTTGLYIAGGGGLQTAYSIIPNPYPMSSVTLAGCGLYTGNSATGVTGSTSVAFSDTVQTMSSTGILTTYYYNTRNSRWQTGSGADASAISIGDAVAILVTRKNSQPSFTWYAPQPNMNLQ